MSRTLFWLRLVACTVAMTAAGPGIALACRCTEPGPQQAFKAAESVAYGKVLSVAKENGGADFVYVFEVAESWKRQVEPQITIHSSTTCAFEAKAGERYVVFLTQYKPHIYDTAMCMGNRAEAQARGVLQYLHSLKLPK